MAFNIKHKDTAHTSPQNYRDIDGNMRTFTMIDMDKKTKINVPTDDGTDPKEELKKYRDSLINKILALPAVYCPNPFFEFTLRGQGQVAVMWNDNMLKDEGLSTDRLTQLYTLLTNSIDRASSLIQ